jgi:hypothetical protein
MSSYTCSLCGLRYPAQPILDLHIREDHAQRADQRAAPADTPAPPPAAPSTPSPAPGTERLSWAETARRALSRMIGRESADPPNRAD